MTNHKDQTLKRFLAEYYLFPIGPVLRRLRDDDQNQLRQKATSIKKKYQR